MQQPDWERLVASPPEDAHVAVVYDDPEQVGPLVATWLAQPLRAGGGALLIGTPEHTERARRELRRMGLDVALAQSEGRLVAIDARGLMARFMRDGAPDARRFEALVADIVGRMRTASAGEVRAWGEMVNILHAEGREEAARELERCWARAIDEHHIQLLCTYRAHGVECIALAAKARETHTHVMVERAALVGEGRTQ